MDYRSLFEYPRHLTVCSDEQTGEAQARVADRLYARHREDEPNIAPISIASNMGRRDDQYETSPSRYHRSRGHGEKREFAKNQVFYKVIDVDDKLYRAKAPMTEPWGTPLMASAIWDRVPLTFT